VTTFLLRDRITRAVWSLSGGLKKKQTGKKSGSLFQGVSKSPMACGRERSVQSLITNYLQAGKDVGSPRARVMNHYVHTLRLIFRYLN
jgi:hypothetical protein